MIDEAVHKIMLQIAFVQGAKWWEYHKTEFTMWPSDQDLAVNEAIQRLRNGSLGRLPLDELSAQPRKSKR